MTHDHPEQQAGLAVPVTWTVVDSPPPLGPDDVHVWAYQLNASETQYRALLSPDELYRADRFSTVRSRVRFTLRRAFLRRILALYTKLQPSLIRFDYGPRGKPALSVDKVAMDFNQTDSGDWTVVAVSSGAAIGVDIEGVDPGIAIDVIAGEVFSTKERSELEGTSEANRRVAFFHGWTRKEATIKANGDGLAYPLQEIEVSLNPNLPARIYRFGENPTQDWSMESFWLTPSIVGAVVVKQPAAKPQYLQLRSS